MQKNLRKYNATVCQGEKRTLQAPNSDVSLDIPKGSKESSSAVSTLTTSDSKILFLKMNASLGPQLS